MMETFFSYMAVVGFAGAGTCELFNGNFKLATIALLLAVVNGLILL
jgi:hypothetical protein